MKVYLLVEAFLGEGLDEDETDLEYLMEEVTSAASDATGFVATVKEIKK